MSLKAKVEAIIYAAEEPVTLEQMAALLRENVLAELAATKARAEYEAAENASAENTVSEAGATESEDNVTGDTSADSSGDPEAVLNATAEVISEAVESAPEGDNATGGEAAGIAGGENSEASPETNTEANVEPAASDETQPVAGASVMAPEMSARKRSKPVKSEQEIAEDKAVKARLREVLAELSADYADEARGMEVRQVAGGYRLATKPEHHDVVRAFAKSLKPPIRLSLAALETLAVIAYKQPVTGPEISDIRGIESAGVLGTLLERKLITTSGRKQVIGRPMQYKTSKEFLLRFGLNEINELPSMEEFSQLVSDGIELAPAGDVEAAAEPTLFDGEGAEGQTEALENDSAENDVKQDEAKQDDAPKKEAVETTSQAEATAAGDEGQRKE